MLYIILEFFKRYVRVGLHTSLEVVPLNFLQHFLVLKIILVPGAWKEKFKSFY